MTHINSFMFKSNFTVEKCMEGVELSWYLRNDGNRVVPPDLSDGIRKPSNFSADHHWFFDPLDHPFLRQTLCVWMSYLLLYICQYYICVYIKVYPRNIPFM